MAESTDRSRSRWRCPACGTSLDPVPPDASGENRLACPDCGGQFRIRVRAGDAQTATFSGEVPAAQPPVEPPVVGGLDLFVRSWALRGIAAVYPIVNVAGAGLVFALGGFVPVGRGWLNDELAGWPDILRTLGGLHVAVVTKDPDADFGPVIARGDAPDLFIEVADVARKLGTRPPEQLRLAYLPCCGVVAAGRSRALLLGLPLLYVLTRVELRAVLAHEMAHLAGGDATSAARTSRFVHGLGQAVDSAPPSRSPLRVWARLCRGWSDRLHAPVNRGQEARADRVSAGIAGGDAAASALVKVAAVQPLFREVLDQYDPTDDESGAAGANLYSFFRRFWSRLPEPLLTSIRHTIIQNGHLESDPAHPALLDRLAAVQSYPARPAMDTDPAPASSVVGDLESLEQMLHNRLFALRRVEPSVFHRAGS